MRKNNTHIVYIITGLQRGGAETLLLMLIKKYTEPPYTYQQSVIFFKKGTLYHELVALGIPAYRSTYLGLYALLKKLNPDIIHSSLWTANMCARIYGWILNVPVYASLHTVSEHSGILRNLIDRIMPIQPQIYIAVSDMVKKSYTRWLPACRIVTIFNGVQERTPSIIRKNTSYFTIGAVGRFVPVKCYDVLIHAFALCHKKYPFTRLMLIGHGPLENALRSLVNRLDLTYAVMFIINKPAYDYYPHFDCFVQPSAHEGFSLTTAEALQEHVPVIVTGHDGLHAFIKNHETGLVIKPHDVQALYQALAYYIEHPEKARLYANNGYTYVKKHFSLDAMAYHYHELFSEGISLEQEDMK